MRRLVLLIPLALAACHRGGDGGHAGSSALAGGPAIACATGGSRAFRDDCAVERTTSPDGQVLVVHHPDGGFRRLLVAGDGRGVVAADGAAPAVVTVAGPGTIEVAVGDDRYRLPATIKGDGRP